MNGFTLWAENVSVTMITTRVALNGELSTSSPIKEDWALRGVLDSNEVTAAVAGSLS